ncbi:SDR family oxidoreductase [Halobacillus litoralis]|uniref:SDR family oxidoreductase n=1 Tax=Halobacillus litoralis TaxID=45668 RepID=UPI001CFE855F|nr:SDR family oxidoreductase [Halobacillus litoralis]
MKPLEGKVAVVAGATRGAGRGIAVSLGEAGATVYCTGRSTRENKSSMNRPETIEETAEMVNERGGTGIPVRVDHSIEDEVKALFERVQEEQSGQLDILVNDIWGSESLIKWDKTFWEDDVQNTFKVLENAIHTHMITSRYGVPLMVERGEGLIVEITDGQTYQVRGPMSYSLSKIGVIHMAEVMAEQLEGRELSGITSLSLTPGFLRSEEMLEIFGVTEENWRDGEETDPDFAMSESPFYVGRALASLAADPDVHRYHGKALSSWDLMHVYDFTDINGTQPDWGEHYKKKYGPDVR